MLEERYILYASTIEVQWTLGYPNTLGPGPVQISEKFGYVKVTVAKLADSPLRPADIGNGS